MDGWGFWEWLGYGLIAVAAAVPAIGATLSGDAAVAKRTAGWTQSLPWRLIPALALIGSALVVVANQLGWTHAAATPMRVVYVQKPDPKQTAEIAGLRAQIAALQHQGRVRRKPNSAASDVVSSTSGADDTRGLGRTSGCSILPSGTSPDACWNVLEFGAEEMSERNSRA